MSNEESEAETPKRVYERPPTRKSWIPSYLSNLVIPYCEDIWCTPFFDERLVAQLMAEGFLPIASREMLLPKLHTQRCVIRWPNFHISKSAKKKGKRWSITVNQDFDGVVKGCHEQHGEAWLYPPIVAAFSEIHKKGEPGFPTMVISADADGKPKRYCSVRVYSIEVRNSGGQLVAGELGYSVGNVYTSLTGFSSEDSAGSAQLAALGMLLQKAGFKMWDLGMFLAYKERLGARQMSRAEFVEEVRQAREDGPDVILSCSEKVNIGSILKPEYQSNHDNANANANANANKKKKATAPASEPCHAKRSREISPVTVHSLARPEEAD